MIQSTPVRAVIGRDDSVFWPLTLKDVDIQQPTGITRMVMACSKDGYEDVTLDSDAVPSAYNFTAQGVIRGRAVTGIRWVPGVAATGLFPVSGTYRTTVYLYIAAGSEGVNCGSFDLLVQTENPYDLLLHFDGINDQTATVDSGRYEFPVTSFGTAALSTAQKRFGSAAFLGGSGKYYRVDTGGYTQLGTADFTMECFVRLTGYQAREIAFLTTDKWYFCFFTNTANGSGSEGNYLSFYSVRNGAANFNSASFTPSLDRWYHCAVSRSGQNLRFFIDGALIGTVNLGTDPIDNSTNYFYVGNPVQANFGGFPGDPNQYLKGYIDEVLIYFGRALYTVNFTPPSVPHYPL